LNGTGVVESRSTSSRRRRFKATVDAPFGAVPRAKD